MLAIPLAFGDVKCPEISIAVQYVSPVTKAKKITCGYMKNKRFVKHGQEIEFDKRDKVSDTKYYHHDKLETEPEAEKETFGALKEILRIFSFEKNRQDELLKIYSCDTLSKTWVNVAMTSNAIQKNYHFSEDCDLSGTFAATLLEEFSVSLNIQNYYTYSKVTLRARMDVDQEPNGILFKFTVKEGNLISKDNIVNFSARYSVRIDPLSNKALPDSEEGTILIHKSGDRFLKLSKEFKLQ